MKKSEEILANILFKRYQQLNKSGNPKGALAGYQKVHYTNYYPDSIKGEAAFNMGMIYTDLSDNNNAMKWYKKSFNFYSKKEIKMKRAFLEKMALRTSLLHNFLNAAKLNKFIVKSFCEDKKENLPIFIAAIRDDLANNYISKVMHTLEKQSHCINKVPLNLKKEILVHLYENNHESDFMSFIRSYKLEKSFKDDIGYYYEQYFWKYYKESPIKSNQFLIRLKKLNNSTSKLLTKSLQRYENFLKKTKLFSKVRITIKKKNPNPNLFINNLTKRIDRLKTISASANKIFSMGHGQVSVLVYDKLTKLADDFATEINNYHIPIDDANFQKQFSHEMDKISSSMVLESNKFKDSSQKLIEKYELLLIRREESHLSFSILQISDIRTPASKMAITTGLGK
ncbi:MAG: hypothetical protein HON90_17870 [Halobacteriovoraceae bacterium]|nr:hypothetical protein [Halobacteriovoraceae bacterium]